MLNKLRLALLAGVLIASQGFAQAPPRIVSLNGTVTEIVCALGFEKALAGVDVTSTYPASVKALPKVGHNRNISAEPVLALKPGIVISTSNYISQAVLDQIKSVGVKTLLLKQEYSVSGTRSLISQIAAALGVPEKGAELIKKIDQEQLALKVTPAKKKVLFIYARGAGNMMVAGDGTAVKEMINMAGAENAITGFSEYKPLSAEALIGANPDVILMFDTGLESMGGVDGLLKVQGVAQTNAGKNRKVIVMDGQYLTGFGPRVIGAVKELAVKING
ncbi:hemin ABC transporter substrate-binding protein [Chitinophaga sp. XS-30]|uniref:heme/hemin ABC transporter substrate-binding protein n=1 Tax=Chitinophaga sp. XS-30 TaxID=2604421 RepID=UPI0011DE03A5|nr:helical backbone metal receptor [Chitinophaga sp. XS-30]QEH42406.1 ABC transporter substrate-binding protein [Chitinophaga sp. XS-30]